MKDQKKLTYYPLLEEKLNIISHAFGFLLSIAALVVLVVRACMVGNAWHIVSVSVFGTSMILLYAASTIYHSAQSEKWRYRLNVLDHASIYVLIAGSYTPFALVTLNGPVGWVIFGIIWGLAITGVVLKLFFIGKFPHLSTAMYVGMGWLVIFAMKPLIDNLHIGGLYWLVAGGIAYTVGALFYSIKKIQLNHAIFHLFVLLGSICHFSAVFFYVLPG